MDKKIEKVYEAIGFGFKVKILNAPMLKIRGDWVLDIDQNRLQKSLMQALANKPVRLTGNEIHFIRQYFEMTTTAFGKHFDVSHVAVLKWERFGNKSTEMNWSTEKDIRLFILSRVMPIPKSFLGTYNELTEKLGQNVGMKAVEIDAKMVA